MRVEVMHQLLTDRFPFKNLFLSEVDPVLWENSVWEVIQVAHSHRHF